ncbi:unnamed protein product [Chilo suppressalis]|uniref:DNA helicase Pif1-like 2B domain-containing protein n=1 Tax=Chilo suppressalis TaxID=168631 RepID=A0ABN8B607_CHISP|nr:unnamed protein product [Chilo suppressalis]
MRNREWLCERAILAPTNEIVGQINEQMMSHVQGDVVEYLSVDIVMYSEQVTSYPTEFLNSLELSGVPSHKLRLKIGVPVLLMRNLEAPRLCNGTRLQITQLGRNIIRAIIMTGVAKDEEVLIPGIPMIPTDLPFQFKRIEFPLKPAFAMTINKAQGQLKVAGVNLEKNCFSHGQLQDNRGARWRKWLACSTAIVEVKQLSQGSVIGWVNKNLLSRTPPCFGRHVKPLIPAACAVVSTRQSALGPRGGGVNIFAWLNKPQPAWWSWCLENKLYACMMMFFLANMIEGQLVSSGAFEISLNNIPLWSKLETGRIPQPPELFQIIDNTLQFSKIDMPNNFVQ